jgi:hypothetical protein
MGFLFCLTSIVRLSLPVMPIIAARLPKHPNARRNVGNDKRYLQNKIKAVSLARGGAVG